MQFGESIAAAHGQSVADHGETVRVAKQFAGTKTAINESNSERQSTVI